jgi:DNA primase
VIDFQALKASTNIDEVARGFLQLKVSEDGDSLRAPCPHCESDNARALIITPAKGLFYCFTAEKGGDLISLVSHCHSTGVRQSAEALAKVYMSDHVQESPKAEDGTEPKATEGFDSDKYIRSLKREQEDVSRFGISAELCEATGIGLCTKGINRGKLAIPVRLEDGTLIGFIGVSGEVSAPKKWKIV